MRSFEEELHDPDLHAGGIVEGMTAEVRAAIRILAKELQQGLLEQAFHKPLFPGLLKFVPD